MGNNLIKFSEFAGMAGLKTNALSVYVKRGKVIIAQTIGTGKDKQILIDVNNPINKAFIKQRDLNKAQKSFEANDKKDPQVSEKEKQKAKEDSYWGLTKKAELDLKQRKAEIAKIDLERQQGLLIPVDYIKRASGEFIARYQTNIIQGTEQLIRDYLNELGAKNEQLTSALSKLTDIVNNSSKRATIETKTAIQHIISEQNNLLKL